mmetsp:Transcript_24596/g.40581  ORF Transcript_24596/g.40581 Transcript_24596/m.40581 type:complete len:229 (-) Transcript_24596:346-1032(-)
MECVCYMFHERASRREDVFSYSLEGRGLHSSASSSSSCSSTELRSQKLPLLVQLQKLSVSVSHSLREVPSKSLHSVISHCLVLLVQVQKSLLSQSLRLVLSSSWHLKKHVPPLSKEYTQSLAFRQEFLLPSNLLHEVRVWLELRHWLEILFQSQPAFWQELLFPKLLQLLLLLGLRHRLEILFQSQPAFWQELLFPKLLQLLLLLGLRHRLELLFQSQPAFWQELLFP